MTTDTLDALHADIVRRWTEWMTPALNTPTRFDVLNAMAHVNAAFADARLALKEPRALTEPTP